MARGRPGPRVGSSTPTTSRPVRSPATTTVAPWGPTAVAWNSTRSSRPRLPIDSGVPAVGRLARSSRAPHRAGQLAGGAVGRRGPLLLDLREPVAQDAAHLVVGEDRLGERLGEQRGRGAEVALRHVDVDEQATVGDPCAEHHAVALHQFGELLGPVGGGALVEQPGRHRADPLLARWLVGQGSGHHDAQGQHVLAGQVVRQHPHAVVEQVLDAAPGRSRAAAA